MAQEQYDIHTSVCLYKLLLTDLYRGRGQRRCFFRIKTFLMENVETLGADCIGALWTECPASEAD